MTEMIERVEHAIAAAIEDGHGGDTQALARAAIEAMREPTEAMVAFGWADIHNVQAATDTATGCYRAMISAALTEPTP